MSDEASNGAESDDVAVVKRVMQARADGDLEAVLAMYHPQGAISPTGVFAPPGTTYYGLAGIRNLMGNLDRRFPSLREDDVEIAAVGDRVVMHLTITPRSERAKENKTLTWVFTIDEGRIRRAEGFETKAAAMAALKRPLAVTVARQFCDAVCTRDVEAMVALCDPDVRVFPTRRLAPAGTSFWGHHGLRSAMKFAFTRFEGINLVPEFHEFGDRVLVVAAVTTSDPPNERQQSIAVMFTIHDGALRVAEERHRPRDVRARGPRGASRLTSGERCPAHPSRARGLSAARTWDDGS